MTVVTLQFVGKTSLLLTLIEWGSWMLLEIHQCDTSLESSAQALLISTQKNRVDYGHLLPSLSALGLINILSDLYSSVIVTYTLLILKCDTSLESSAQALLISTQKE